jgi:hypothetical protein
MARKGEVAARVEELKGAITERVVELAAKTRE